MGRDGRRHARRCARRSQHISVGVVCDMARDAANTNRGSGGGRVRIGRCLGRMAASAKRQGLTRERTLVHSVGVGLCVHRPAPLACFRLVAGRTCFVATNRIDARANAGWCRGTHCRGRARWRESGRRGGRGILAQRSKRRCDRHGHRHARAQGGLPGRRRQEQTCAKSRGWHGGMRECGNAGRPEGRKAGRRDRAQEA